MFWRKKKKKNMCEHEWFIVEERAFAFDYEVYCPKCNTSKFYDHRESAEACVTKSKLRNEYLENKSGGSA